MARSLPSRGDVLKLFEGEEREFHARDIAKTLGVLDDKYEGLVRLLDNLSFDGTLMALDGHKFRLAARAWPKHEERHVEIPRRSEKAAMRPRDGRPAEARPQEPDGKPARPKSTRPEAPRRESARPKDGRPRDGRPHEARPPEATPQQARPSQDVLASLMSIVLL